MSTFPGGSVLPTASATAATSTAATSIPVTSAPATAIPATAATVATTACLGTSGLEAGDQAVVLAHDDVPPVVGADVVTAVPPECCAQVGILDEQAESVREQEQKAVDRNAKYVRTHAVQKIQAHFRLWWPARMAVSPPDRMSVRTSTTPAGWRSGNSKSLTIPSANAFHVDSGWRSPIWVLIRGQSELGVCSCKLAARFSSCWKSFSCSVTLAQAGHDSTWKSTSLFRSEPSPARIDATC